MATGDPAYLTSDTYTPSTWQAGQATTPQHTDLSHLPLPTQDQVNQQRQTINQRLKQYGYQPQQLSDQQVLATMAPLPQTAVQWPDWVQDYLNRHPDENVGPRLGVDVPTDQTYEEWNLKNHGISGSVPTTVGASYGIPRGALIERYGQAAVDAQDEQWVRDHSTNPQALAMLAAQQYGGQASTYMAQAQALGGYPGVSTDYHAAGYVPSANALSPTKKTTTTDNALSP
ncbi:MAG TPA: hypothetical protein VGI78_10725 [Acetobacteraceae bacterium]|jgi:hypothetical protein